MSNRSPYWSQGQFPLQPHVHVPQGTYEEEHGRQGFYGRASHLYHRHPPTGWLRIEGPLLPRAYRISDLGAGPDGEKPEEPQIFLFNADVRLGSVQFQSEMRYFARNADGDEVRFVHQGSGRLETDYGDLNYEEGDYLVIPRGTTYRWIPFTPSMHLCIESTGEIVLPDRGLLGRHAQFDPMVMRFPQLPSKERTRDIRPIISPRFHLPPSVHTTFLGKNFVICSFLPRPLESEEGAMKVPFYHRNIDCDEVIFYHAGQFFSREGISPGALTWHPLGIHHGPHPKAAENASKAQETQEIAVMVDTYEPLVSTPSAEKVEVQGYAMSWKADQKR
jgi:homogentisate 1,2-dioxygenase